MNTIKCGHCYFVASMLHNSYIYITFDDLGTQSQYGNQRQAVNLLVKDFLGKKGNGHKNIYKGGKKKKELCIHIQHHGTLTRKTLLRKSFWLTIVRR